MKIINIYFRERKIPPVISLLNYDDARETIFNNEFHNIIMEQVVADYLFNDIVYNK